MMVYVFIWLMIVGLDTNMTSIDMVDLGNPSIMFVYCQPGRQILTLINLLRTTDLVNLVNNLIT